jgi:hypothetical protein
MKTSKWFMLVIAVLALLSFAGGWATVTLDALPENVVADQPLQIGFVVRQHGTRPLSGLTPVIRAMHADTGEKVAANAKGEGEIGHYVATITLPTAGTWNWEVDAFGPISKMAPLTVAAAAPAPTNTTAAGNGRVALAGAIAIVGLAAGVLGLRAGRER